MYTEVDKPSISSGVGQGVHVDNQALHAMGQGGDTFVIARRIGLGDRRQHHRREIFGVLMVGLGGCVCFVVMMW
eukprot:882954-Amorphochlora_amoeboformis.AAC.1